MTIFPWITGETPSGTPLAIARDRMCRMMWYSGFLWVGIPTLLTIFGWMSFAAMSTFREWVYQTPVARKPR